MVIVTIHFYNINFTATKFFFLLYAAKQYLTFLIFSVLMFAIELSLEAIPKFAF